MIGEFIRAVYRELAPNGTIRAAVHYANPSIVRLDERSGQPSGLAVDIVDDLAHRLAVPRVLLGYEGAGQCCEAGAAGEWDIGFLAAEPARCDELAFTMPYLVLEGKFLVRADSRLHTARDADAAGVAIAVVTDSFHDLHLTRTLRHARLVRSATLAGAVRRFLDEALDAVAGLDIPLTAVAAAHGGLRIIAGRYSAVEQAIAVPKGHAAARKYLDTFLQRMDRAESCRRVE